MRGLGHAEDVAAVIPLEVPFQVDDEVAALVGGATGASECGLAAFGAKLLVHVLGDGKAAVAAENPVFELGDASEGGGDEVEIHAESDILHGVVRGEDGCLEGLLR